MCFVSSTCYSIVKERSVARAEDCGLHTEKYPVRSPLTALELLYGLISPLAKSESGKYVDNPARNNKVVDTRNHRTERGQKNGAEHRAHNIRYASIACNDYTIYIVWDIFSIRHFWRTLYHCAFSIGQTTTNSADRLKTKNKRRDRLPSFVSRTITWCEYQTDLSEYVLQRFSPFFERIPASTMATSSR